MAAGPRVVLDWGPDGLADAGVGADVVVVVDVLSFATTVSVAVGAGVEVLPFAGDRAAAEAAARAHDGVCAVGRRAGRVAGVSLSPVSLLARTPPPRLVLPSPNGSTVAARAAATGADCVTACLRDAGAVAEWLDARRSRMGTVAVIAAGERRSGGTLRPAVEDLWGAGAVVAGLRERNWTRLTPEADAAAAAWAAIRGRELAALRACVSGRELARTGFGDDVAVAAAVGASDVVARLSGGWFRAVDPTAAPGT